MGKVSVTVELKPEGADVDLEEVLEDAEGVLPENAKITDWKIEPVGFGIEKLIVQVTIPDGEGGTERVEEEFSDIDGIQSVDAGLPTRL